MEHIQRILNNNPNFVFFVQRADKTEFYQRGWFGKSERPFGWVAGVAPVGFSEFLDKDGVDARFFALVLDWFPLVFIRGDILPHYELIDRLEERLSILKNDQLSVYTGLVERYWSDCKDLYQEETETSIASLKPVPLRGSIESVLNHPLVDMKAIAGIRFSYYPGKDLCAFRFELEEGWTWIEFKPGTQQFKITNIADTFYTADELNQIDNIITNFNTHLLEAGIE